MLIGISGFAGAGKDSAADGLVNERGFCRVSLADPLKRICRDVYAFTDEQLWGPSHCRNEPDKRYPRQCTACVAYVEDGDGTCQVCNGEGITYLTPREALQKLGTEWGRHCYENTWVDHAIRTAKELLSRENENRQGQIQYDQKAGICFAPKTVRNKIQGVAIPDVRFRNEIDAIQKAGGIVVRVVRSGAGLDGAYKVHQSEAEMASIPDSVFDVVIKNEGTLEDLRAKIVQTIR